MLLEDLGLIGNCQLSALVERSGAVVWSCWPRFDSEPIFSRLLDEQDGGYFLIGSASGEKGHQKYIENTNVLETTFQSDSGAFKIIDFIPRFEQYERIFRPTQLHRIIEPISGTPRVKVRCAPRLGWSKNIPSELHGSHHVRFEGFSSPVRLTTDIPLAYLGGEAFTLTKKHYLVLTWGTPIEEALSPLCERFLSETVKHWHNWVKRCNIPPFYQQEVIRSALVLKLHCYEDTGAIVAAMTTSIPESIGSRRTWDYRYCWLRDAAYVLGAFRLLGQFEERENFINFLLNVAGADPSLKLAPLFRVDGLSDLDEQILENWPGFNGEGPVRVGNAAALQQQNDIYGEMVLALIPIFFDDRHSAERSPATLSLLERLTRKAIAVSSSPDAGIWENRSDPKRRTFTNLMCWAAADRMAKVAEKFAPGHVSEFSKGASDLKSSILHNAWDKARGSFAASFGGTDLDASLLQMVALRFLPKGDLRLDATVDAIWRELAVDDWVYRYRQDDGFGQPTVAFVICTFWMIEALANLGRLKEARALMANVQAAMCPLGLMAEDFDPRARKLWGNFPQAYSHVGLIHAAFGASVSWSELL